MPVLQTSTLIDSLQQDIKNTLAAMEKIRTLPADILLEQPAQGKWSIAQVVEHLNGYNRFYLASIENGMRGGSKGLSPSYKTGWFGNYFTKLMQPKPDGTIGKKMSAPKEYNFLPDLDADKVVEEFVAGQEQLITLLEKARNADMGKVKVAISISKFIKLKLGDTFRFLIAHQIRHFIQLERVKNVVLKNRAA